VKKEEKKKLQKVKVYYSDTAGRGIAQTESNLVTTKNHFLKNYQSQFVITRKHLTLLSSAHVLK
jgi:hypothetical protein